MITFEYGITMELALSNDITTVSSLPKSQPFQFSNGVCYCEKCSGIGNNELGRMLVNIRTILWTAYS